MKRLLQTLRQIPKKTLIVPVILATVIASGVTVLRHADAAFGPDRPTKAYTQGVQGFDHVTFNSFTGVPNIGDERNFLTGKIAGAPDGFYDPMTKLRDGDEVLMRVYVHNGADPSLNTVPDGQGGFKGIARNTRVRVQLPNAIATTAQPTAFVSADNAQPQQIFDTLDMRAENGGSFQLEYVPGSANLKTNFTDVALSDEIVRNGVQIGDQAANGQTRGCFEYVELVTFKVKVKMPRYIIEKTVRKLGDGPGNWKESVNAKPGDTIQWRVHVANIGKTQLNDIAVVDELPNHVTVKPGTVQLDNANNPNGFVFGNNAIQGRQVNVSIGDYLPDSNANVYFDTTIDNADALKCGTHELVNTAFATPAGFGSIKDTAKVVVTGNQNCDVPTPIYKCDLLTVTKIGDRKYSYKVDYTAANGATVKSYTYDFGDGSTALTTDKNPVEYTYAKEGNFIAKVTVNFAVPGQGDKSATSAECAKPITIPTTPTTPAKPKELPKTGAGSVVGIFSAVSMAGAVAHRYFIGRRFN